MVEKRGEGGIVSLQVDHQHIERVRDVFHCVGHIFYHTFCAIEDGQLFSIDNPIHVLVLRLLFLPRTNQVFNEFRELYNNHQLRMESNWTPNQMWLCWMVNPSNP